MTAEEEKEILELLETRSINEVTALSVELKNEVHRLEAENINELIAAHNSVKDILDVLSKARSSVSTPCSLIVLSATISERLSDRISRNTRPHCHAFLTMSSRSRTRTTTWT